MNNKEEIVKFSKHIEGSVKSKSISYMDAIVLHCETTGLEVEVAAKLVSPKIKSKIKKEATVLNLIKKT